MVHSGKKWSENHSHSTKEGVPYVHGRIQSYS